MRKFRALCADANFHMRIIILVFLTLTSAMSVSPYAYFAGNSGKVQILVGSVGYLIITLVIIIVCIKQDSDPVHLEMVLLIIGAIVNISGGIDMLKEVTSRPKEKQGGVNMVLMFMCGIFSGILQFYQFIYRLTEVTGSV